MSKRMPAVLLTILFSLYASMAIGQSTSPWVFVKSNIPTASTNTPELGATYLTVEFLASRIYQDSNWWTNLVEDNRKAVVDVSLTGRVRNVAFEDSRASRPIELRKNKSHADPGWRTIIVQRFPTTYSNLQLTVRLSKSAEDGLDSLLGTLASISTNTPGLQLSQTALGALTATKQITDYLFQKHLLVEKVTSTLQFPDTGSSLPAGVYVALAADSADEYERYLAPATGANAGLLWNGTQLLWNGQAIPNLSYFVVRVDYADHVFSDPLNALSFNAAKPWAALYQLARRKIGTISKIEDIPRISDEIRAHLTNAQTLLDDDPDFTQLERDRIHESLLADAQKRLTARIEAISSPLPSAGVTIGKLNSSPVLLKIPKDIKTRELMRELRSGSNSAITPR